MGNQSSTLPNHKTATNSAAVQRTPRPSETGPRLTNYTCDVIYHSKPLSTHITSTETRSAHASRFAYFKHIGALSDVQSFVLSASTDAAQEINGVTRTISRTFDVGGIGRVRDIAGNACDVTYALKHFDSGAWHEYRIHANDSIRSHSGSVLMLRCQARDQKWTVPFSRNRTTMARNWRIVWEVCPTHLLDAHDPSQPPTET